MMLSYLVLALLATTVRAATPAPAKCNSGACARRLTLSIEDIFVNGRWMIGVNGTTPGPRIEVNENDFLWVTVINNRKNQTASGLHWHGMLQAGTQHSDGAIGITNCAIPPGKSLLYKFHASPPGTFWYHGHMEQQYVDGLIGPLIINPAAPTYKKGVDYANEHAVMISDFYLFQAPFLRQWYLSTANPDGTEPIPDAVYLNQQADGQLTLPVTSTQITRLRLINSAAYSMFQVTVDGLSLTVIEVDGTEVQPYVVSSVTINVAQRMSVLIDWSKRSTDIFNQSATYLRVTAVTANYPVDLTVYKPSYNPNFVNNPLGRAVFNFIDILPVPGSPIDAPNAVPQLLPTLPQPTDFNFLELRPTHPSRAPDSNHQLYLEIRFQNDANGVFRPYINGAELDVPTIEALTTPLLDGSINGADDPAFIAQYPFTNRNIAQNPSAPSSYIIPYGSVMDVLINNTGGEPHPVHYHGYSFYIVATSEDPTMETRYRDNYLVRDTVTVIGPGWAKIRFVANNPGVWIMHCHYDWHMAAGFAVTLHVGVEQTRVLPIPPEHEQNCCNYNNWLNPTQPQAKC